jgi:ABC-type antimicrobial peptide transport system permease subunit
MLRFVAVSALIAGRALSRNRLRTILTMLGVIIGVAAVIAMVALGTGARSSVERTLRSAGTNIILVSAGNYTRGGETMNIASGHGSATTLTSEDADALREIAGIESIARGVRTRSWIDAAHRRVFAAVRGTDPALLDIHVWQVLEGEAFTPEDVSTGRRVALVGRTSAEELFGVGFDAVGEVITINGFGFKVVGTIESTSAEHNETVFVPVTVLQNMLNVRHLHTIEVSVGQAGEATRVADEITRLLRERHQRGRAAAATPGLGGNQLPGGGAGFVDDFTVKTQAAASATRGLYTSVAAFALANMARLDEVTLQEMSSTLARAGTTMTALLGSIAAISLLVGGIGIMNIMLVSVTERTQEIGLRLAVGARRRDVLVQFLVEAVVLSLAGGIVGVAAGVGAAYALTVLLEWPTRITPGTIALAFGIAAGVGVAFGFYPARRASRLDPIDALRYE